MISDYKRNHIEDKKYRNDNAGEHISIMGWVDYEVSEHAILSHRRTFYNYGNFSEKLHTHDFYELVIYLGGAVEYTNGDHVFRPCADSGCMIINRPSEVHTTRLLAVGEYERYVLYFDREFLMFFGACFPFAQFLDSLSAFAMTFDEHTLSRLISQFGEAVSAMQRRDALSEQDAYICILSLFSTICLKAPKSTELSHIPENILKIKSYVDVNCCDIKNVNMIADSFFYSREHVSRLFKKYFNTNLSDYLAKKKCEQSCEMLRAGEKVGTVYYKCGFGSIPSYVRAFKRFYRILPSEYSRKS